MTAGNEYLEPSEPRRILRHTIGEVTCLACGRDIGIIKRSHGQTALSFCVQGASTWVELHQVANLPRCAICGGTAVVENVESRFERIEPHFGTLEGPARRGRPPRWLIEKRREQRELEMALLDAG